MQQYNNDIEITGKSILVFEIIKKYIGQILEIDKINSPFRIYSLEQQFNKEESF